MQAPPIAPRVLLAQEVMNAEELEDVVGKLATAAGDGSEGVTFNHNTAWFRAMVHGKATKIHSDYYYLRNQTDLLDAKEPSSKLTCEQCQSPGA